MFVHLRAHSAYSFLEALPAPADLALAAVQQAMPALALTDHQGLSGAVEFYDACHGLGVHPLQGLELDIALPGGMLAFLAMDAAGWRSLCRLSSAALTPQIPGHPEPVSPDMLAENTGGLICLTGGRNSPLNILLREGRDKAAATFLGRLSELYPGRLYVELQLHDHKAGVLLTNLVSLARRLALPIVATHSIHSLEPDKEGLLKTMAAIRLNTPRGNLKPVDHPPPGANFLSAEEMAHRFREYPQALMATLEIAERCRLELPLGVPNFPELKLPEGQTPIQALRAKAEQGAKRLYGDRMPVAPLTHPGLDPEVRARLDHELGVIENCGYASLFLVMEEIINFARRKGVPISSRGSAASSLVAHCLGITSPDPLRLNLYFERFLNPARATPPDIDTDLCSRRRDEVIRFVYERYGAERVAMVCTVNRFRRRSALRETAKAYGLSQAQIKKLVDSLPNRGWGPPSPDETSQEPYARLAGQYPSQHYQQIFRDAASLLGLPHYISVHPGGVVIAPGVLTDRVPVQLATKGVVITQFDMDSIERMGLVKIDLLGIRGLTVLGDVAQAVTVKAKDEGGNMNDGLKHYPSVTNLHPSEWLDSIPEDDPATAEMVQAGGTIGCFQIESPGMRATLKEIRARSVDDIMVALALYRPGPLTGGLKDAFVRRHRGMEEISHLHPALEPLLADTYGVILYQEQVLRIAHELAGFNLAEADLLRRAMSHFDPGKVMQTLQEKFISGAQMRSQVPEAIAGRVWELMAAFAGYGFPKAHAASYAQIAWRAAWCKLHYPALFMAAVLANWGGYYGQRVYLTEARRLGLMIRPPHINWSGREFSVQTLIDQDGAGEPVLFMGLGQVRELTHRTLERILRLRPFHSLHDFLSRTDPRPVEAENLVKAGALHGMGNIPDLLKQLQQGGWRGGQLSLFSMDLLELEQPEADWSLEEQVQAQEVVLGVGVTAHMLELRADEIAAAGAINSLEAASHPGRRVRVAGMRQTWARSGTARGEKVYYISLEDLDGMLEVVIPARIFHPGEKILSGRGPFLVEGMVELDDTTGEPFLRADRVSQIVRTGT